MLMWGSDIYIKSVFCQNNSVLPRPFIKQAVEEFGILEIFENKNSNKIKEVANFYGAENSLDASGQTMVNTRNWQCDQLWAGGK